MLDFFQKRKLRRILYHKLTIGILVVMVLFAMHSTYVVYRKKAESQELALQAENRLNGLNEREAKIQSQIKELETPVGVESEIRAKFNVVKGEENMVVILDDQSSTSTTPKNRSLWQKFLDIFR